VNHALLRVAAAAAAAAACLQASSRLRC
jgi:hypothetical protein